jgi:hypothetical protein
LAILLSRPTDIKLPPNPVPSFRWERVRSGEVHHCPECQADVDDNFPIFSFPYTCPQCGYSGLSREFMFLMVYTG